MSADEDTELRDLVSQTLERNGVLGKIRAQLRASVFLALEEQESVQSKTPFLNQKLKTVLSTKEGRLAAGLVQEFLEFFDMQFTQAVFEPESGIKAIYEGRDPLAREFHIPDNSATLSSPLLIDVLKKAQTNKGDNSTTPRKNETSSLTQTQIPKELSSKQIADARKKFHYYDKDHSGYIDRDELRTLFVDMFPHFHRNMLDRYLNDEFKAVDRDFNNAIDFDEFLTMYKRLFVQCRSVVSDDASDIMMPLAPSSPKTDSLSIASYKSSDQSKKGSYDLVESQKSDSRSVSKSHHTSHHDPLGSDIDEDPFFDDPVPGSSLKSFGHTIPAQASPREASSNSSSQHSSPRAKSPSQIPVFVASRRGTEKTKPQSGTSSDSLGKPSTKSGGSIGGGSASGGMSFLGDLPPLVTTRGQASNTVSKDTGQEKSGRGMGNKMNDFDFGLEEDYDDDFSSTHSGSLKSSGHAVVVSSSKPDPARITQNMNGGSHHSVVEEIEEDIEELSIEADDLLKSQNSAFDEQTSDKSLSQTDAGFDYSEEIQLP